MHVSTDDNPTAERRHAAAAPLSKAPTHLTGPSYRTAMLGSDGDSSTIPSSQLRALRQRQQQQHLYAAANSITGCFSDISGRYSVDPSRVLGTGAGATVYECEDLATGERYAVKTGGVAAERPAGRGAGGGGVAARPVRRRRRAGRPPRGFIQPPHRDRAVPRRHALRPDTPRRRRAPPRGEGLPGRRPPGGRRVGRPAPGPRGPGIPALPRHLPQGRQPGEHPLRAPRGARGAARGRRRRAPRRPGLGAVPPRHVVRAAHVHARRDLPLRRSRGAADAVRPPVRPLEPGGRVIRGDVRVPPVRRRRGRGGPRRGAEGAVLVPPEALGGRVEGSEGVRPGADEGQREEQDGGRGGDEAPVHLGRRDEGRGRRRGGRELAADHLPSLFTSALRLRESRRSCGKLPRYLEARGILLAYAAAAPAAVSQAVQSTVTPFHSAIPSQLTHGTPRGYQSAIFPTCRAAHYYEETKCEGDISREGRLRTRTNAGPSQEKRRFSPKELNLNMETRVVTFSALGGPPTRDTKTNMVVSRSNVKIGPSQPPPPAPTPRAPRVRQAAAGTSQDDLGERRRRRTRRLHAAGASGLAARASDAPPPSTRRGECRRGDGTGKGRSRLCGDGRRRRRGEEVLPSDDTELVRVKPRPREGPLMVPLKPCPIQDASTKEGAQRTSTTDMRRANEPKKRCSQDNPT
ncbi:hypothetical protein THAOC_21164 [Thalassiosira oceanica]|uniref:Protein kinase domain-containing protein n=1 Tax=Thalassiosira oceanica TaxID=159749 RepID=K0SCQ6_THAOC|nr:hypothetical protein THAOC_21164 [Thalassiosira oceanica]|eukprot:EJK58686.1 hypothetical protein THAOC_21164 [Thalassiosira oceanica]